MRILDLYAGAGGERRRARIEARGHTYVTLDMDPRFKCNLSMDMMTLHPASLLEGYGRFDLIWASPPCEAFSVASIGHHWTGGKGAYVPKTPEATQMQALVVKTIEFIRHMAPTGWIMENPRGVLRKLPCVAGLPMTTVTYCLAGETKVITRLGEKPIKDLVGIQELLMPDGTWKKAPIRSYGVSKLKRITLNRAGMTHVIRATPNHLWPVQLRSRTCLLRTENLRKGDAFVSVYSKPEGFSMSTEGIAHGFVFGDGSNETRLLASGVRKIYSTRAQFCGKKDEAMIGFFGGMGRPRALNKGNVNIGGLPKHWKLPPSECSPEEYLRGWLSGYFAADGSVSTNGQCTICSSKSENIDTFRSISNMVGIGSYFTHSWWRLGYRPEKTALYQSCLIRSTLKPEFFQIEEHRRRFRVPAFEPVWRVVSVEDDSEEEVFCAEVDGYEMFVLSGNILTHNCRYGDSSMKPTDLWGHVPGWTPRPMCCNGHPDHDAAPRGARTGTQGKNGAAERAVVPWQLWADVIYAIENNSK